jgi:hypothetical protein
MFTLVVRLADLEFLSPHDELTANDSPAYKAGFRQEAPIHPCAAPAHPPIKSVHFGARREITPTPPPSSRNDDDAPYIWFKLGPISERTEPLRYDGQPVA